MSTLKVKITQPCVVVSHLNKAVHAAIHDVVEVVVDDAYALVGAGRAVWEETDKKEFIAAKQKNQN
jgi:hypothetical protein